MMKKEKVKIGEFSPEVESIMSLVNAKFPSILTDNNFSCLIRDEIAKRVQGTLLIADLGCGSNPVSSRVMQGYPGEYKIMAVDSNVDNSVADEKISYYECDIRDTRDLNSKKGEFFSKYKSLGKNKFDVIFLSNILNYMAQYESDEFLGEGEISPILEDFINKFIAKKLTRKGILVIQNGDKVQRDVRLEESQVNDYFSPHVEELLGKHFLDFFYVGIAAVERAGKRDWKKWRDWIRRPMRSPIVNFTSLGELSELRQEDGYITAVNVRCMISKKAQN